MLSRHGCKLSSPCGAEPAPSRHRHPLPERGSAAAAAALRRRDLSQADVGLVSGERAREAPEPQSPVEIGVISFITFSARQPSGNPWQKWRNRAFRPPGIARTVPSIAAKPGGTAKGIGAHAEVRRARGRHRKINRPAVRRPLSRIGEAKPMLLSQLNLRLLILLLLHLSFFSFATSTGMSHIRFGAGESHV